MKLHGEAYDIVIRMDSIDDLEVAEKIIEVIRLSAARRREELTSLRCVECGYLARNERGKRIHIARAHKAKEAA